MKKSLFLILGALTLISCNVQNKKKDDHKSYEPKQVTKQVISQSETQRLGLNSSYRQTLLDLTISEKKSDQDDINESLDEYIESFKNDLQVVTSYNTDINLYTTEIFKAVLKMQEDINKSNNLNMLKTYSTWFNGYEKNVYITFLKKLNSMPKIVDELLMSQEIETQEGLQVFARQLSEIIISQAILIDKDIIDFELLTQDELTQVIIKLDKALYIKEELKVIGYDYKLKGQIKRKLARVNLDRELLENNERLLEIQVLVDRLLN